MWRIAAFVYALAGLALTVWVGAERPWARASEPACLAAGAWADGNGRAVSAELVFEKAARADVVLVGERHGEAAHHAWQSEVLSALAALERPVALGIEYLPRGAQLLLHAYVAGHLDEAGMLAGADWDSAWGYDFDAYRGLFETARARHIPILALNVERSFVRQVARFGFEAAAAQGAPIGRPAPASPAYAAELKESFESHGKAADPDAVSRFIEAQTSWDRAMAETIAQALSARPGVRIVATMGAGHVAFGHGVAHQLFDLGEPAVFLMLPAATRPPCPITPGAADAFYGAL
jgi:uncharacterized iron-regulated protein